MASKKQTLGKMVDAYISARALRLDLEKQANKAKEEETAFAAALMAAYKAQNVEIASGSLGYAKYHCKSKPRIGDWNKFCKYVAKHDAFDLFEKRVSVSAVEARKEEGEEVAGLEWYVLENFSVGGV